MPDRRSPSGRWTPQNCSRCFNEEESHDDQET
ncbi:hypothetical protein RHECNPAF_9300122 [Rhizobium etli CNPAF512]|nr:hypothetical protein RHECNPAF_9300122 [Rhizobium etli CNPAF512]